MRIFRKARWLLLALVLLFIPTSRANAGVYISVGFAPPILPMYEQPPCPEPDLLWSPGYWAYGDEGYYWVPGAWVPAPYEGAMWTPPYWGWREGNYVFYPGYWGPEVGYYGGVNYGFGYGGIGFFGGRWHEHRFEYNTAVVHVNETIIHTTYIDRTVIREHEVEHDSRVAYAGGPGGIHHDPNQDERHAMQVQHLPPTQYQQQHFEAARNDHSNYFNANHGRPQNVALARPLQAEHHDPPSTMGVPARGGPVQPNGNAGARGDYRNGQQAQPAPQQRPTAPIRQQDNAHPTYQAPPRQDSRPAPEPRTNNQPQQRPESRPAPEPRPNYQPQPRQDSRPAPDSRPNYQPQQRPESRPAPEPRPNYQPQPRPESRPAPEPRNQAPPQPRPESRPAPEPRYQAPPQPRPESRPAPEPRYQAPPQPRPEPRPAPESRPAPPPRQEARPAPEPRHDSREPHDPNQKEPRR